VIPAFASFSPVLRSSLSHASAANEPKRSKVTNGPSFFVIAILQFNFRQINAFSNTKLTLYDIRT
jgi:hypothetical protein